jgi:APA family basic amino acid/polyamine antiporter
MPLERQFGLWTASALVIGQVIAVGIFLTPAGMAKSVQSPFWLFAIWAVVGLATLCGALTYGELAARFPEAGGPYVFLREAYGKMPAFLFGWVVLLAIDPGLTAIFGVGLAGYASYIYPMSPFAQTALAISVVLVCGLVNIRGAGLGAGVLKILIALKVGSLLSLIIFGFLGGNGDWSNFSPFFASPPDWTAALIGGSIGAYFAFAGWWEVARLAGEIEEPQKNMPRALVIGIGVITLLYSLTSAVFYYLVPVGKVGDPTTFAAQAGEAMFGSTGGVVFAGVVILSVLGTIFAYLMGSPRLYYAMAKDGLFFRSFGELHEKYGTPHRATLIQMGLACILITTGTFDQILAYFFFVAIAFILIIVAGIFRVRRVPADGYKTPLYPVTPIVFIVITAFVAVMLVIQNPVQSLLGAGVVAIGVPVYLLAFRRK